MRLVMLGTGPFAVPTLERLAASPHEVALVVARPPRGRSAQASPLQLSGESLGLDAALRRFLHSFKGSGVRTIRPRSQSSSARHAEDPSLLPLPASICASKNLLLFRHPLD